MRTLTIDVTDVGGQPREGDYVLLQAPQLRGSSDRAGAVIATSAIRVDLRAGRGQASVEPGPLLVHIRSRSLKDAAPFEVVIPNGTGTVTLRSCMERHFRYVPLVETAVAKNADRAHEAWAGAVAAERKATAKADEAILRVDAAVNRGAELVREQVRRDADRAETGAQTAASKAADASSAATAAAESKAAAALSATAAAASERIVGDYKVIASEANRRSQLASQQAEKEKDKAKDEATKAESAATSAMEYRDTAERHANSASDKSAEAAASAAEAKQYAANAKTSAPEGGWKEEQLHTTVKEKLNRLEDSLRIASGGYSVGALGKTIAVRDSNGQLFVSDYPSHTNSAVSKRYVDDLKLRRQTIFTSTSATTGAGNNMALQFNRVHGSIRYSGNRFYIGQGIFRITVSARRNENVLHDVGLVKVQVFDDNRWLAASDGSSNGLLSSASVIVDTRGLPNAYALAIIDSKIAGTHMLVLVENLTQ